MTLPEPQENDDLQPLFLGKSKDEDGRVKLWGIFYLKGNYYACWKRFSFEWQCQHIKRETGQKRFEEKITRYKRITPYRWGTKMYQDARNSLLFCLVTDGLYKRFKK